MAIAAVVARGRRGDALRIAQAAPAAPRCSSGWAGPVVDEIVVVARAYELGLPVGSPSSARREVQGVVARAGSVASLRPGSARAGRRRCPSSCSRTARTSSPRASRACSRPGATGAASSRPRTTVRAGIRSWSGVQSGTTCRIADCTCDRCASCPATTSGRPATSTRLTTFRRGSRALAATRLRPGREAPPSFAMSPGHPLDGTRLHVAAERLLEPVPTAAVFATDEVRLCFLPLEVAGRPSRKSCINSSQRSRIPVDHAAVSVMPLSPRPCAASRARRPRWSRTSPFRSGCRGSAPSA